MVRFSVLLYIFGFPKNLYSTSDTLTPRPSGTLLCGAELGRSPGLFLVGAFYQNEPDYYSGKFFFRQTTECMRSGHFLQNY